MGKIYAEVGTPDPRLNTVGSFEFRMGRQMAAYAHQYPTPSKVRLLPIPILQCLDTTAQGGKPRKQAITDLTRIALFYLLHTGQYRKGVSGTVSNPFRLQELQFYARRTPYDANTVEPYTCTRDTFYNILFENHKN